MHHKKHYKDLSGLSFFTLLFSDADNMLPAPVYLPTQVYLPAPVYLPTQVYLPAPVYLPVASLSACQQASGKVRFLESA